LPQSGKPAPPARNNPEALYEFPLLLLVRLGLPLVFALFWWLTHEFGCPQVLAWRPRSVGERVVCGMLVVSFLYAVIFVNVLLLASMRLGFSVACGKADPFATPRGLDHVVFTARIVATCCVAPARLLALFPRFGVSRSLRCKSGIKDCLDGIRGSYSSRSTLRTFPSHFSLKATFAKAFFPGSSPSWKSDFCGRTGLLREAQVDLRVLHDGPPKNGVRIIGRVERYVLQGQHYVPEYLAGEAVVLTGPLVR
jgi:hypothetical protein